MGERAIPVVLLVDSSFLPSRFVCGVNKGLRADLGIWGFGRQDSRRTFWTNARKEPSYLALFAALLQGGKRSRRADSVLSSSMVKHLDPDYFVNQRPTGYVAHFWDTIDALGGPVGLTLLSVGILLFYFIVQYTIHRSRQRREAQKNR